MKVYCGNCEHIVDGIHCGHPENVTFGEYDTWFERKVYTDYERTPNTLNENNNCKWYDGGVEWEVKEAFRIP